jgi:hypothetical protein
MLQMHAREPGDAVHRSRKPHGARDVCRQAARRDAGRRLLRQAIAAQMAREPGPPARGEHAFPSKARDALKAGQRQELRATFLGKIEIGNDDDEFVHEGVF